MNTPHTEHAMRDKQLLIFDWDGTLFDSTATIAESLCRAARELGLGEYTRAHAQQVIGLGFAEAAQMLVGRSLDAAQMNAFMMLYRRYYFDAELQVHLFDGMQSLLTQLADSGRYLAVATGKSRVGLNHVFETRADLKKLFIATRTADQTASKPNPLMLHEILEELDVAVADAVMIGDTRFDIDMAHRAQMHSIAVTYGAHDRAELVAARPTQMAHTVAQLTQLLH